MNRLATWKTAIVVALTCPALVACGQAEAGEGGGGKGGRPAALVSVAPVSAGALRDKVRFLGRAEPVSTATLAASVAGPVVSVEARVGDAVAAGDPLVALEDKLARAALDAVQASRRQVTAELSQARRELARIEKLQFPVVSDHEKEQERLAVQTLSARKQALAAEIRRAEEDLARHRMAAPFAGVVTARHVSPGTWVRPGDPLIELVSTDELEIFVDVAATLAGELRPGTAASLFGRADQQAKATVRGIVPSLDRATRTLTVRLGLEGARPEWLIAGLPIFVEFEVALGEGLLVPRDALVQGPVEVRVMLMEAGKAKPVTVEVLGTAGDQALVRAEGLKVGAELIVRGNERVRPGQPVRVGSPDEGKEGAKTSPGGKG